MSPFDDHQSMSALEHTDELVVTGRPAPPTAAELTSFVAALRATAAAPAPRPSAALSALLRDGLAPPSLDPVAARPRPARPRPARPRPARAGRSAGWRNRWRSVVGLGLAAKIVLGAGVAVASVGGAATIDAVPDVVQLPARAVVSGVVGLFTSDPVGDPDLPAPARVVPAPTTAVPTASGAEVPGSTEPPGAPGSAGSDGLRGLNGLNGANGVNGLNGAGNGLPAEGRSGTVQVPARPAVPSPSGLPSGVPSGVGARTPPDLPSAVPQSNGLRRSTTSGSSAVSPPTVTPPTAAADLGSAARKAAASATPAP